MDSRQQLMRDWLNKAFAGLYPEWSPASADASFRRYFRAHRQKTETNFDQTPAPQSIIVMDAPPDKEPIAGFLHSSSLLSEHGIHVPKIYASDTELGFIALEDLGSVDYLQKLSQAPDTLYADATDTLVRLQTAILSQPEADVELYSKQKLDAEMQLFEDWYITIHLKKRFSTEQTRIWSELKSSLINVCRQQPQVWVHRDFHSRNLMVVASDNPGVIDFQDMVIGPISYDLASLFKDCYIRWPRTQQLEWLSDYHRKLNHQLSSMAQAPNDWHFDFTELVRWYDLVGLQRHLKVLGIFSRLNYRDNKPHYLDDLPLVKQYVVEVMNEYAETAEFAHAFAQFLTAD